MNESLTPLETIALSKSVKETAARAARPKLDEGHHDVDFTVRVRGPLLVAPPSPAKIAERVPAEILLSLVLENLNAPEQRKARKYVERELADWKQGAELPEVQHAAREHAELIVQAAAVRERETTKNGNVTAPLTVELVGRPGERLARAA
jgi:hypothetical protein